MTLSGIQTKQITVKSDVDALHEIFRYRLHQIPDMSPEYVKSVSLQDGHEWGTLGSIITWTFFHDGKPKVAKEKLEAIDNEKKLVCYKVIGGDILEAYKTFSITVQVDTNEDENVVTWTFHYEKLSESVPNPDSLMDFILNMTKDIEAHLLKN